MAAQLGIKDFAYFVFHFAIQFYWQGGGCSLSRKGFGKAGLSWEMWKMGWTPQNCCRRWTVMECVPGVPIIMNSPRFFSTSFLKGQVVWKNFTFTYTWLPILKAGDSIPGPLQLTLSVGSAVGPGPPRNIEPWRTMMGLAGSSTASGGSPCL